MTVAHGSDPDRAALEPTTTWPIRCPVDGRWLTGADARCPDCGSPTNALVALNGLAAQLLGRARASESGDAAVGLVDDASALVPSTEPFELAAAGVLEQVGRPDLAALRVESALRLAPRRADLQERLAALRLKPVRRRDHRRVCAAIAALTIFVAGASIGTWALSIGSSRIGLIPSVSPTSALPVGTHTPGSSPSDAPGPTEVPASPTPAPTTAPSSTPRPPSVAVRAALDADPALAGLHLSVEDVGSVVRIAGLAPDAATARAIRVTAVTAAAGSEIDTNGITTPPPPTFQFVQPGDTLWTIAARAYGDPTRWRDIAKSNPDIDPRRLVVGTRLLIPDVR